MARHRWRVNGEGGATRRGVQLEVRTTPSRIALLAALTALPAPAASQVAARDSVVYRFAPASRFDVKTGKAGLFGFAGHEHLIRARGFSGRVIYYPGAPTASRVDLTVRTDSLEVLTPPDREEIRKVTEAMRTDILRVDLYPTISFTSKALAPADSGFHLVAELTLVGQTRDVPVDLRVAIALDTLWARASFTLKQTDCGIRPFRGGPAGTAVTCRSTLRAF